MRARQVQLQIAFDQWVNTRLLDTAEKLPEGAFLAEEAPTNLPLRASLVHLLDTEWAFRCILAGEDDGTIAIQPEVFPTLADLRARWATEDAALTAWAATLSDEDLDAEVVIGDPAPPLPRWIVLHHVLTHSRQLQADVATILSGLGHSPGDIDFLEYLRQRFMPGDEGADS